MQTQPEHEDSIRLMLGGDVMLGRIVKEYILRFGPAYPLEPIAGLLRAADLTVVNLECAITSSLDSWPGARKAFYFGAPPEAMQTLAGAGIDMVSLANNHILDFGIQGLLDTLDGLRMHGIRWAGAGADIDEALASAIIDCHGIRFGMAAFCDHQPDFAAGKDRPGMAHLDLDDEPAALDAFGKALEPLRRAAVDWPVLSLHWGPNMVWRPSDRFRRLAHGAVEMGWKILFGHSAHVFHGIEILHGCPIIYAAGDLVDDYRVDPEFGNDHQLLFELELDRGALRRIDLHPVFIEQCRTQPADQRQFGRILARMTALCDEMGTRVQRDGDRIWIEAWS